MAQLKGKRELFCLEYVKHFNATLAYKTIYKCKSNDAANSSATRLLAIASVRDRIEELKSEVMAKAAAESQLTVDWVVSVLSKEATNHGKNGSASARVRAAELLGKHLGMRFTDHTEITGSTTMELVHKIVTKRADLTLPDEAPQPKGIGHDASRNGTNGTAHH